MDIIFVRHGKAEPAAQSSGDFDRALTAQGRDEMWAFLSAILPRLPKPERIFSSPYLRAMQTAEVLSALYALPVESTDALGSEEPPAGFISELLSLQEHNAIVAVSHFPLLIEVIQELLGKSDLAPALPRGGICWLKTTRNIGFGTAEIVQVLSPEGRL